ncbi:unnamed protein product [Lactuca saligna]|uniref:Uncharacterized protein n=1 Tax=Lactuca saligna TaxID=75948 RepID=A0AA35Z692_LACSI|nr:unnamed protein product [Lactuca saligna]
MMRCLDCGNKAKKDCLYYRCRSCCKGHGFNCQTHVKSTWVPVSTRQIHVRNSTTTSTIEQQQMNLSSSSGIGGHFPMEVNGESTFTCVRVATTSRENEVVDQYAYETSINIGGRIFRGILYDQGPYSPMMDFNDVNVNAGDHRPT